MKKQQSGFTLIELMIVVAIIGILAAIAIPSYMDYTKKAKASELVLAAAPAKLALSDYVISKGSWPDNATTAGYTTVDTDYVASVSNVDNVISVVGDGDLDCLTITLTGSTTEGAVQWECSTAAASTCANLAPSSCRP
jgi:type IV pilus assembly protein PilA